jgi:hypothetical protein
MSNKKADIVLYVDNRNNKTIACGRNIHLKQTNLFLLLMNYLEAHLLRDVFIRSMHAAIDMY